MEPLPHWPNAERAAHYRDQAQKLRVLADAEPVGGTKDQLLALAEQYEQLVLRLAPSEQ